MWLSNVVKLSGVDANSAIAWHGYRVHISVKIHCSIISFGLSKTTFSPCSPLDSTTGVILGIQLGQILAAYANIKQSCIAQLICAV